MTDWAVGTAEVAAGETELRDFDGVLGSAVTRAVVVNLDELEVVEDVAVEIECCSGYATLEGQDGSKSMLSAVTKDLSGIKDPRFIENHGTHSGTAGCRSFETRAGDR